MKVIILNPPRYYWPFLSEGDNYMLPQALPCLAAVLREHDIEVKPIDCLPLKIGWKSLERLLTKEQPDVLAVSTPETMFSHEGLKACKLMKKIDPSCATVVGGHHFSATWKETLENHPYVDFVVIGEGEYTLLELVKELEKPKWKQKLTKIKGIALRHRKKVVQTKPRPLIKNLDELPLPAYDLMPMKLYGKGKLLWCPGGTTIHHGRGCIGNCKFCACWVHMGKKIKTKNGYKTIPFYRTKSPERTVEEVELLRYKYGKKFLVFTDDTWNVDPKWNEQFCKLIKERGIDFEWHALMRSDFILRDEKLGIMKKIVDSGLRHVCIGGERCDSKELKALNKPSCSPNITYKVVKLLKEKYPEVFVQVTFIVGFRNESKETLKKLYEYIKLLDPDFPAIHPITPVPGTKFYEEAKKNGWIEVEDFKYYDWMTPVMGTDHLSREELEKEVVKIQRKLFEIRKALKGIFSRYSHKRRMYLWVLFVGTKITLAKLLGQLSPKLYYKISKTSPYYAMVKPKWYDK